MKIRNISLQSKVDVRLLYLAIGNFDGVHLGHQQIINTLVNNAKKNDKLCCNIKLQSTPTKILF